MKTRILTLFFLLLAASASAQVLPWQATEKTTPVGEDEIYSAADVDNDGDSDGFRRILFDTARTFFAPDIKLTVLSYDIDSTGLNVVDSLRGNFVIDASGDWWYVDYNKKAVALGSSTIAASGVTVTPTGNLASSDAQSALQELQTDIDGLSAGTVPDGDKGDITVSSSGTVWNIDAGVIGTAEIATDGVGSDEIAAGAVGSSELASTAVTPGSYTLSSITVDADGRLTSASTGGVVDDTTPQLGGNLDAQGNNITDLGDVTFSTGAGGGTLRTGTANADKFTLQAYDVNGGAYVTLMEADADNDPFMQIYTDYFRFEDVADDTKIAKFDVSGITTGTTRTFSFPDQTGTLALTSDVLTQEQVEDYAGGMVTGNTETLITVTYQDADGTIDYVVDNDLANYDNTNSAFLTSEVDGSTTNEIQTIDTLSFSGTTLSASLSSDAVAASTVDLSHAATHLTGGADEIDGDKIDIDWTPSNYTPASTPTEADNVDNLTSHLYGVDQALATAGDDLGDHIMDQNLQTNGNWISGDGGNEGIYIDADGKIGVNNSSPVYDLDVVSTTNGVFRLSNTQTDLNTKVGRFYVSHYNNAEEPLYVFAGASTSTDNFVAFGGGNVAGNAATQIDFYTATTNTTTTGTSRMTINGNGDIIIPGNIEMTGTGAAEFPAGSTAQRPVTPAGGKTRYNTTTSELEYADGTNWWGVDPTQHGSASTSTDGSGDITVSHGFGTASITVTATATGTTFYNVQVHTKTTTNFKIRFFDAAGSAVTSTAVTVDWIAKKQ